MTPSEVLTSDAVLPMVAREKKEDKADNCLGVASAKLNKYLSQFISLVASCMCEKNGTSEANEVGTRTASRRRVRNHRINAAKACQSSVVTTHITQPFVNRFRQSVGNSQHNALHTPISNCPHRPHKKIC